MISFFCRPMYGFVRFQVFFIVYSSTFLYAVTVLQACGSFISHWCRQHAKHWHLEFSMIIYFSRITDNIKNLRKSKTHIWQSRCICMVSRLYRLHRLLLHMNRVQRLILTKTKNDECPLSTRSIYCLMSITRIQI